MSRKAKTSDVILQNLCTFDSVVEAFLNHRRLLGLAPTTLTFYNDVFHYLSNHDFSHNLAQCTTTDIESYISQLLINGMKPVTVNAKLRAIKALFQFAHSRGLILTNPLNGIKFVKHEKNIIKTLDYMQLQSLLKECADGTFVGVRDHSIILLMLDTGARANELLGLRLGDVDLLKRTAVVMGKGRKARHIFFGERTRLALDMYLSERGDLPHSSLFVTEDNSPLRIRSLQDRLKDLGKRAGITNIRVSPHTFRHTFAKMYIQNGGDVFTLQKLLGHTTIEMVRNYVEMFGGDVATAHAKFSPVERLSR